MSSKYRRVSDADQRLFSDVSMCNIVVCDKMREACGSSINVEIPMDIDSVLMDTIIESEFELWATYALFLVPHPTQRRSGNGQRVLSPGRG
jgi:hypothetical protein